MEPNIKFHRQRDPLTGLKQLEKNEMITLFRRLDLQEYIASSIKEEEISFRDIKIKIKNTYLHPASIKKISLKYPEYNLKSEIIYQIPELEDLKKYILLPRNANDLIQVYNCILANPTLLCTNPPIDVTFWISLFCIYGEEFCSIYDEYITSPDDGVGQIPNIESYIEEKFQTKIRTTDLNNFDIKATCHLILISMNKSFIVSAERDRQIKTYLLNRKSAVYSSFGVPIGELNVTDEFFAGIGDIYRMIPILKRELFFFCYQNQIHPEFSTACVLLSHSAMTTIKTILDFINQPQKTLAHSEIIILEEISRFIDVTTKKKEKDGALWPYHRILHPSDGDLNAANFPNLAVSAIEYHKRYGSDTFKFMVTPTVPIQPGIKEKATILDTRDIYITRTQRFSEEAKRGAKELGLDVNKLMGTNSTKEFAVSCGFVRKFLPPSR